MSQNKEEKAPEKKPASHTDQLLMMREFTERFGVLMEGQMLQLRLWPFAVDPEIDNARADADIEGKAIYYHWTKKSQTPPDAAYFERLKALQESLRLMLGPTWVLNVSLNGALIFPIKEKSVRTKPKPKSKPKSKPNRRANGAGTAKKRTKRTTKPRAGRRPS